MVTSAPCSQRSAQMSCAELLEPMTTHFLPANGAPLACWLEWYCSPAKRLGAGNVGTFGGPDSAGREHELLWAQRHRFAVRARPAPPTRCCAAS